uniref:IucA/IucC family protein n=1 Tax=Streptomyces roseoverticillatus TaxID=66429 RepID=UPI001F412CE8|nr:IucA/IucC family protein [Streptomyces roseoverticillatus]
MTAEEDEILARALRALLREDPYDLRPGAVVERRPDGDWLVLPGVDIPVRPDGFQCEIRVRPVPGLGAVLDRLREGVAERDLPGFDAFRAECDQAVAMVRLQWRERSRVVERLAEEHGPVEEWTGVRGSLAFEALAAFRDHPVYPTGRVRNGLDERQLLAYAPEFRPAFGLRWLVLPRDALALGRRARLPRWWPTPASLGLARSGDGYLAAAAGLLGFTDPRVLVTDDGPLADLFTTVPVHLCAAALAFELAERGRAPLDTWLGLLRDRLTEAVDRLPAGPAAVLRARVLKAPRLPIKAMVTAGTLFSKDRSGAVDINKYYADSALGRIGEHSADDPRKRRWPQPDVPGCPGAASPPGSSADAVPQLGDPAVAACALPIVRMRAPPQPPRTISLSPR